MPSAVVLLSGGIDSMVTGAIARERGFEVSALSIAYGQRHGVELDAAERVGRALGISRHVFQTVDLRVFGRSALTDAIAVPLDRPVSDMAADIPITYVPARNTIFLSLALALAESIGAFDLFIGANAIDYSGYPDCRPAFIAKFEELANVATAAAVDGRGRFAAHAPLIQMTKARIIREGVRLCLDFSLTHSCYAPDERGRACGRCDSCRLRARGFAEAGVADPTLYVRSF
ncbi:MAG: 7-cyano-7-deazaguanine synthase QueC [Phycisphaerales bacterium]|nr:7-cyano-7-deazaguanine synthase QueC [Phycisphaerales bacterium]